MGRMYEGWCPRVGQRVVYTPHPGAAAELGEVVEVRGANAMVLYVGDRTAKSTPTYLLNPAPVDALLGVAPRPDAGAETEAAITEEERDG